MNCDEFDGEIRSALRVRPSQYQIARLERFWEQQARFDRRRRIVYGAAIAASMLLAGTLSAWKWLSGPTHAPLAEATTPEVTAAIDLTHRAAVEGSPHDVRALDAGRPPTAYEQLIFAAHQARPVRSPTSISMAVIDRVIEQIKVHPTVDVERLAEAENLMDADIEAVLLHRLRRSDVNKDALLRLLAVCGSRRSIPEILNLGRQEALRDRAVATLERIAGVAGLADAARQTRDPYLRRALIARLLVTENEGTLRHYLSFLHEVDMRAEALAVAETLPHLPLASLFALLEDEHEPVRVAAAIVLGHVNGPEVAASLIELVSREPSDHTEAWMALLACRGQRAQSFVAFATLSPQLLGRINHARIRLVRMIP